MKLTAKLFSLLLITLPVSTFAISIDKSQNSDFIIQITSKDPQPIFGSYMADAHLTMINGHTPYTRKVNARYVQLMVGTDESNPRIKIEIFRENKKYYSNPNEKKFTLAMSGDGHTSYECISSSTSLIDICKGYIYAG